MEQAAKAAGAYENTAVVTAVDFVVGFENEEISSAEVKAGILEILKEIKTNATLTSDITREISSQIQEYEDSKACLNHGRRPKERNPHWIRPDTCCGNRPYNRGYHGCCKMRSGHVKIFDVSKDICCEPGVIHLDQIDKNCHEL